MPTFFHRRKVPPVFRQADPIGRRLPRFQQVGSGAGRWRRQGANVQHLWSAWAMETSDLIRGHLERITLGRRVRVELARFRPVEGGLREAALESL